MTDEPPHRLALKQEILSRQTARDEAMMGRAPSSDIIRRDLEIARLLTRLEQD